ncbi:TonB-dependent receptor domain-containing protein [Xanthocytophaga flava]|uniref:TonB-dependent receptor domain-containing protein n=1 Tax=Xanthocytophaga flava TaxID=3048013 RepID=UPI0028D355AF|nr:TonB-dependent receptor [Xanthocytophaga flavus]MDJ1470315.1 TonB-dependent receptor [Xanthocytophaga flavus]
MRSFIYPILFIFLTSIPLYGQTKASLWVKGKVLDASTSQPVEFASVALTNQKDNKVVHGTVTDAAGNFEIGIAIFGIFTLSVDFIGYTRSTQKDILIDASHKIIQIPAISLVAAVNELKEVTVVGKTPIVENKIDKMVYNAANDITSQGGVALDVLRKVPQVSVDLDGNVELQGNSNIRFLINGKPSTLFGNNIADALSAISASQIQRVEVLTAPGSSYDGQGTGGIINIVLKENRLQGVHGSLNLTAGTRLENGSMNLNLRKNNLGINLFISGNKQLSSRTPNSQNRLITPDRDQNRTQLIQNGYQDFERSGYQSGIGFDWSISKMDNLTGSVGYTDFRNSNTGSTNLNQQLFDSNGFQLSSLDLIRHSASGNVVNAWEWSLNYSRKFKREGQQLTLLYTASFGKPSNIYNQTQFYPSEQSPYSGTSGYTPGTNRQTNLSLDYTYPFTKNIILETGAKTVIQHIGTSAAIGLLNPSRNEYLPDSTQSYQLQYDMHIYAGYMSATFGLFNYLNVKAGLRFEHTNVKIDFPNTSIPSYNTLLPSLVLSHTLTEDRYVKLSFTRRIERADYREINPFMNLSDPYNITTGNPVLKPEIGNNIELGYNQVFKNGASIYMALFERINTNDIKFYTTFYPTYMVGDSLYQNVSLTSRQNIGIEYNSGISLSSQMTLIPQLNLRGNLMLAQKRVVNTVQTKAVANGINYRLNLNLSYQLPWDLVMEAFGNYSSAVNTIQGKRPQQFTYTLGGRKFFKHKNASIGFVITNPFNRYINQITTIYTDNYTAYNRVQVPYRSFGINFTYKFGKLEVKKEKEQNSNFLQNAPSTDH